jgi:hypothetical protein
VIAPAAFDLWLDGANVDAATAAALIAPAPENLFEAYAISTAVNRTANDSPDLIEPLPPDGVGGEPAASPVPVPVPARTGRSPAKAKPKKDDGQASLL